MTTLEQAQRTLQYVSTMSLEGALVKRFTTNPHVYRKDSVHEHIARIVRLAVAVLPLLREEYQGNSEVLEALYHLPIIVSLHDDEEILGKADIATFAKVHDQENDKEIKQVKSYLESTGMRSIQVEYLVEHFTIFRKRDQLNGPMALIGNIAKVLDNVVGNQVAIEDKIGLIQPDYTISCIDYVKKYLGKVTYQSKVCSTIDALISTQIEQIHMVRAQLKDPTQSQHLATFIIENLNAQISESLLLEKIQAQLAVDLDTHQGDQTKAYIPVWEYTL